MTYSFRPITELKLVILDHTEKLKNHIKITLRDYKSRWNESLASNILIVSKVEEIPPGVPVIVADYHTANLPSTLVNPITAINSLSDLTHYHLRKCTIDVVVEYTECPIKTKELLTTLPTIFAFDTEAASILSNEDTLEVQAQLSALDQSDLHATQTLRSKLASNALVMQKNQTTMYSFAGTENAAFVISSNNATDSVVLEYLTETTNTVIMHNALYDMRLVHHRTGKFIKNFEDTQLIWATILNHVMTDKAKVGLKGLAGTVYADWACSKDLFGIEHKFNEELINYSGIDACACLYLWNEALVHKDFQ